MKEVTKLIPFKVLVLLFFILVQVVVYRTWFTVDIFSYGDWWFAFARTLKDYIYVSTWDVFFNNFGGVNIILWRLPLDIAQGVFGAMGFDMNISEKFLFFWPWIIGSVLAGFFLVKKVTKSYIGGLIGALIFSYNTYFLAINTQGHMLISIASIFATFALLWFMLLLETRKIYYAILVSLGLFLSGTYDLRVLYMIIWIMFFYFLWQMYFFKKFSIVKLWNIGIVSSIPMLIFILLTAFYILPLLFTGVLSDNAAVNRGLFGNEFWNIESTLTLFHPFWSDSEPKWFKVQGIPLFFWAIPVTAFLGVFFNRKNKEALFFGFLAILGIFLAKQVDSPFEWMYPWLNENLPGFNAFREASKFYFLIILGYSVSIGFFVSWLIKKTKKIEWRYFRKYCWGYVLVFVVVSTFLSNGFLIASGNIGTLFVKRSIPVDYKIMEDFLLSDYDYSRVLWMPTVTRWSAYNIKHPRIFFLQLLQSDWDIFSEKGKGKISFPSKERIMNLFYLSFANNLLDVSSIRYVIVPLQDIANDDDFFVHYGGRRNPNIRQWYIDELDKLDYLEKIDIGTEELVVYENKNFRPHVYVTDEQETIYEDVAYREIDFEFENPTEYRVSLENISKSTWVNFSEAYHPDWKLAAGGFRWFDVIAGDANFISDEFHVKNDASLNSFKIDPEYIKQNFPVEAYTVNDDGSIDVELVLYFRPQSYFYLGLIISGTTLVLCLGYLGFVGVRSVRRRRSKKLVKSV